MGFDAYDIGGFVARGAQSEVVQARHVETGDSVAMKRIKLLDINNAQKKEVDTEIKLLQMMEHPNLIKYHTHFIYEEESELIVVMEFASGGTLAQKASNVRNSGHAIEESLLWRWMNDVANALAYLHHRRVLHRDVKPSHLFLGENKQAKLGDFNLSRAMSVGTQCAFSCVGTPFYMSPEMVKDDGYSFSSDVWSLGCTVYELAVGYPPFFRTDMDFCALGEAICSGRYPELPSETWSKDFVGIVAQILTVQPSQRPTAQQILDTASCKLVPSIQDFKILGTLGRGKFSEVHRSLWKAGGDREVALKRIQIYDMDTDARRECNLEVSMLQRLEHTTIIKYLGSFMENSELIIVLELAAHGDVEHLLRQMNHEKRGLAEAQVWAVFFQVIDALNYMHGNRMMHRDIKPANIFVCAAGVVKLGDLGLGRFFSENTYRAHSVVGTPFYMSPEVITSSGGYSFKSDIWSTGCVLYELATLVCPFAMPGMNYYALGMKISNGQYDPLPQESSPRIKELCGKMIIVDQEERVETEEIWKLAAKYLVLSISEDTLAAGAEDMPACLSQASVVVQGLLGALVPAPPKWPPPCPAPRQIRGGYNAGARTTHEVQPHHVVGDVAAPPQLPTPGVSKAPPALMSPTTSPTGQGASPAASPQTFASAMGDTTFGSPLSTNPAGDTPTNTKEGLAAASPIAGFEMPSTEGAMFVSARLAAPAVPPEAPQQEGYGYQSAVLLPVRSSGGATLSPTKPPPEPSGYHSMVDPRPSPRGPQLPMPSTQTARPRPRAPLVPLRALSPRGSGDLSAPSSREGRPALPPGAPPKRRAASPRQLLLTSPRGIQDRPSSATSDPMISPPSSAGTTGPPPTVPGLRPAAPALAPLRGISPRRRVASADRQPRTPRDQVKHPPTPDRAGGLRTPREPKTPRSVSHPRGAAAALEENVFSLPSPSKPLAPLRAASPRDRSRLEQGEAAMRGSSIGIQQAGVRRSSSAAPPTPPPPPPPPPLPPPDKPLTPPNGKSHGRRNGQR
eukprot:TRINITY_DN6918_c0_g3_i1.p1 TRINITY_DN6918_c0_g3~~TRINITY_DN6918_c0_g3_i1.p1  ORF type:complete len:1018 (-),score=144.31 TRINITY_DN6918_c0_g3_i1:409-3462(-)